MPRKQTTPKRTLALLEAQIEADRGLASHEPVRANVLAYIRLLRRAGIPEALESVAVGLVLDRMALALFIPTGKHMTAGGVNELVRLQEAVTKATSALKRARVNDGTGGVAKWPFWLAKRPAEAGGNEGDDNAA